MLFARLPDAKHRALSTLAASWGMSLSALVESLIDQLLFQTVPNFDAPQWLLEAVESGALPIDRCTADEGIDPFEDNVVPIAGGR